MNEKKKPEEETIKNLKEKIKLLEDENDALFEKIKLSKKAREKEVDYWNTILSQVMEVNADMMREFLDDMVDEGEITPWYERARDELGLE